jgi:hypothetical protein
MGLFSTKSEWEYKVVCGDELVLTTENKEEANKKVTELQFAGKHHVRIEKVKKVAAV